MTIRSGPTVMISSGPSRSIPRWAIVNATSSGWATRPTVQTKVRSSWEDKTHHAPGAGGAQRSGVVDAVAARERRGDQK